MQHGYAASDGELQVPGRVLLSAYPAGHAHYQRHLDCYGDDNSRSLTLILYANDPEWDVERDGGCLVLEDRYGQPVTVAPSGGGLVVFSTFAVNTGLFSKSAGCALYCP